MTAPSAAVVFGRNVRLSREARGWTLREMAPMAGLRYSALQRIEVGNSTTLATAERIAAAIGKPLPLLIAACWHCLDSPKPGTACDRCGKAEPAVDG